MPILIGGSFPEIDKVVTAAEELKYQVVVLGTPQGLNFLSPEKQAELKENTFHCDATDDVRKLARMISGIIRDRKCEAVIPLSETLLLPLSIAAERNGLPTLSLEAAKCSRDKAATRQYLKDKNIADLKWALCESAEEVRTKFSGCNDIVLKPNFGFSSKDVFRLTNFENLEPTFEQVLHSQ